MILDWKKHKISKFVLGIVFKKNLFDKRIQTIEVKNLKI